MLEAGLVDADCLDWSADEWTGADGVLPGVGPTALGCCALGVSGDPVCEGRVSGPRVDVSGVGNLAAGEGLSPPPCTGPGAWGVMGEPGPLPTPGDIMGPIAGCGPLTAEE